MKEIWKDITGYEGLYQVSNLGNVKSVERYVKYTKWKKDNQFQLRKSIMLAKVKMKNGYIRVLLSNNGHHKLKLLHRLVAQAFIPNPNNFREINHKDCDKSNNNVNNLEWVSSSQNKVHAIQNGLYHNLKKVAQYKNGKKIAIYDSITIAAKSLGLKNNGQSIGKVALGKRKRAYGYQWKYVE